MRELDPTTMEKEVAEAGLKGEATQPRTVPRGVYNLRTKSRRFEEDENTGYLYLTFAAELLRPEDSSRIGSLFLTTTWHKYRTATGRLAKPAVLFGQILKAFDLSAEASAKEAADAMLTGLVGAFVTETMRSPDGTGYIEVGEQHQERDGQVKMVTREEAVSYIAEGYTLKNYVQSIFKAK